MLELNRYEFSVNEERLFRLVLAGCSVLLSLLFYRNVLCAVIVVPMIPRIRRYVIEELIERRRMAYLLQFRDMLFLVSTAIGAGRSMKDAIGEAIPGLVNIYGHKAVLVGELKKVHHRIEAGRENDVRVLYELAIASGLEDVIDYVTVYSICKVTGASLIIALNKASNVIMDKITIEREVKELVRRKKKEGLAIYIMPAIVILFLNICSPDYIAPLYNGLAGRLIMTAALAGNIGVYGLIQKIVKVDI